MTHTTCRRFIAWHLISTQPLYADVSLRPVVGACSSVGEICLRDCMRPHIEPTENERERFSVRVPVIRQYGEVAFAMVQAMSVGVCFADVVA
jgi:hypothetical protein